VFGRIEIEVGVEGIEDVEVSGSGEVEASGFHVGSQYRLRHPSTTGIGVDLLTPR
jgi:hypothetical protein